MTPRYRRTRVEKIRQAVNEARIAINTEFDHTKVQAAWDRLEPWLGYIFENHHCPECGRQAKDR